jgi:hypothetical protein
MSPVVQPLTQLHISDIRKAHSKYINMEISPGVSAPQFAQIFTCLQANERTHVFKYFGEGSVHKRVDINEVFAVAILTATAFVSLKIRVLFQLYDLDDSMDLSLSETVMLLGSAVRGLCRCTDGIRPSSREVEHFCCELFRKIDVDADERITEEEWISACSRNPVVKSCLNRFCRRESIVRLDARCSSVTFNFSSPTRPSTCPELGSRSSRATSSPRHRPKKRASKKMHKPARRRSTGLCAAQHVMRDVKREVRLLRETFEAIDEDGSETIDIEEFLKMSTMPEPVKRVANRRGSIDDHPSSPGFEAERSECGRFNTITLPGKSIIPPHIIKIFSSMDEDGDGKITWVEILRVMFKSYGKKVVEEILSWPLEEYKKGTRAPIEDDAIPRVESQPIQDTLNVSVPERIFGASLSPVVENSGSEDEGSKNRGKRVRFDGGREFRRVLGVPQNQ